MAHSKILNCFNDFCLVHNSFASYSRRDLHALLGMPGQRSRMILYRLQKFRLYLGHDFNFTEVQIRILQSMDSSFIVLHCCAGAGKTIILVCICLWVLKVHLEGVRACVHFMADSQETVLDFLSLVREIHGSATDIGPLGFDAESWTDRLSRSANKVVAKWSFNSYGD